MEPSEHPQGHDPTASASPEQGPGNEVVAPPIATGCADIGELLPALLGAVGEGLLVLGATESPPIWHNPQALPALRLLEPQAASERWEQLVTQLREQLADATEASPLVRLPHNVESPTRGRLHFIDGGAVDWVLRRIAGQSDRWLLQLRDVVFSGTAPAHAQVFDRLAAAVRVVFPARLGAGAGCRARSPSAADRLGEAASLCGGVSAGPPGTDHRAGP